MNVSVLFPGQGSQSTGMGKFLYDQFHQAKLIFEEASDAIQINMAKLCFEGSEGDLALTENTQPALVTVSSAFWKVLATETPIRPFAFAGHSVGEYSALVAAGALSVTQSVQAVRLRGRSMQAAVPVGVGSMIALLGLDDASAFELCERARNEHFNQTGQKSVLSPANFNAPGQIVLSGHQSCIDFLRSQIKTELFPENFRKAKLIPLNVSAPFHCELMLPAERVMSDFLESLQIKEASTPVYQNVVAKPVRSSQELRSHLVRQVSRSVLWTASINQMIADGSSHFIECGSGKVLAGLGKKIRSDIPVLGAHSLEEFRALEKWIAFS
jgi:[acyl-carrier-protein] S-malonyltransferase